MLRRPIGRTDVLDCGVTRRLDSGAWLLDTVLTLALGLAPGEHTPGEVMGHASIGQSLRDMVAADFF